VRLDYDWDVAAPQRELRRALDLNPGSAWAHHWYAHLLEAQNRLEDALAEMRAALALDPFSIAINWDVGNELVALHRYGEAERHLKAAADLFPNNPVIGFIRAEAFYGRGDTASGHRVVEEMKRANPELAKGTFFLAFLGVDAARDGHRSEALEILNRLEQARRTEYVEPFGPIQLCGALHDRERLALWMKRLEDDRSTLYATGRCCGPSSATTTWHSTGERVGFGTRKRRPRAPADRTGCIIPEVQAYRSQIPITKE
jgi:serine/threonine-protein kinase